MTEKKQNRRSKEKFKALKRELNTKVRRYYIEPDYINGVFSEDGMMLIRPLTLEEKEWLNKYYEETIVTNFKNDSRDFYETAEQKRALYNENNCRNRDLFNKAQVTGQLQHLNNADYEQFLGNNLDHLDHELLLILDIEPYVEID